MIVTLNTRTHIPRTATSSRASLLLWIAQGLLALLYVFAGSFKVLAPADQMVSPLPLPVAFLRFIGTCEMLGALGLVLPGLTRIRPGLTPLAGAGLVIIMLGATTVTLLGGGGAGALFPLVVGTLAASVAYGRWRVAPQRSRTHALLAPRPVRRPVALPTAAIRPAA